MKLLLVLLAAGVLAGCVTAPKNPLVYEDANVAIYKVCSPTPIGYVCHQQLVNKKAQTAVVTP